MCMKKHKFFSIKYYKGLDNILTVSWFYFEFIFTDCKNCAPETSYQYIIKMSRNMNEAVMSGNMQEVQMRINMGEDVNQMVFPRYTTPLHDATTCGRTEIARLLIKM